MFLFPFTSLHELNLDWILDKVKTFSELIPPMEQAAEDVQTAVDTAEQAKTTAAEAKAIAQQAAQGVVADGSVTTAKLVDDAVTAAKLADLSVTTPKLANNAVTEIKLDDDAVTATKIKNLAVINAKLADSSVTTGKLDDAAVTTAKLNDAAVTTAKLNDAAVTTAKLDDGAVTTVKLDDGAVTTAKLDDGIITRKNLLDNWYFVGGGSQQGGGKFPINQRGQLTYSGSVYSIDRWKQTGATGTVSIVSDGLQLQESGQSAAGLILDQYSELDNTLVNQTVTLSVLVDTLSSPYVFQFGGATHIVSEAGLHSFTVNSYTTQGYLVRIYNLNANGSATISAIKLELGDAQTLAHQENGTWVLNEMPNYTEILIKCQEYFQIFRTSSFRPTYAVDFRPCMLTDPTLDSFVVDGDTYYSASSDL